jgi:hypothetical protein
VPPSYVAVHAHQRVHSHECLSRPICLRAARAHVSSSWLHGSGAGFMASSPFLLVRIGSIRIDELSGVRGVALRGRRCLVAVWFGGWWTQGGRLMLIGPLFEGDPNLGGHVAVMGTGNPLDAIS